MRRDQVGAVRRAVDRYFTLLAATNGADFLAFRGTESFSFAFFTDRTGHSGSQGHTDKPAEYSADGQKTKSLKDKTTANHGLVTRVNRHGIGRARREIRTRNCRKAAGAVNQHNGDRTGSLYPELQINPLGRRIGVVKAPVACLMPARIGRLAKSLPVDARAENFRLRDPDVKCARVARRGDAEMKRARYIVRRILEQLRLRRR